MVEAACVGGLLRGCRLLPCRGRQERTTRFTVINTCMAYRFVLIYLYAFLNRLPCHACSNHCQPHRFFLAALAWLISVTSQDLKNTILIFSQPFGHCGIVATRTLNKDILILVKLFLERRNEQLYGSGIADAHELLQLRYIEKQQPLHCHIYSYYQYTQYNTGKPGAASTVAASQG